MIISVKSSKLLSELLKIHSLFESRGKTAYVSVNTQLYI
jgi:hypothetical protein